MNMMEDKTTEPKNTSVGNVVIHIHGGNNQILPNATGAVQHFYNIELACAEKEKPADNPENNPQDEAERIARGTLCIYYPDKKDLDVIIHRISDCRSASDLANLVVNDMQKNTILTTARMVSRDFIEALQQFTTFSPGGSTGNIRTQINNARRE